MKPVLENLFFKISNFHRKYFCVKQRGETDCGAACIATIAKQYGHKISLTKIRNIAGTDKKGTNALGLITAAENLGFSARGVKAVPDELNKNLSFPLIAHVIQENIFHYVVVHKISRNKIIVADPAEGIIIYEKDEFTKIWSGILIFVIPEQKLKLNDRGKGLFYSIIELVKPNKRLLLEIFIISLIYSLLGALGAFYFKYLIDTILVDGLVNTLHIISLGFLILTVFKGGMNAFRKHLLLYLGQKIDISLILNYYQHILKLPLSFFDSRKTGEILSRLRDATKIRQAVSGITVSIMIDSLFVVVAVVILYLQCSSLFWITLLIVPIYILLAFIFNKPFQRIHKKEMENSASLQSYLVESVSGIDTIKAFTAAGESFRKTEKRFIKFIRAIFKAGYLRNIQHSLHMLLGSAGEVIILWVGGREVIKGNISIGQLITYNALLAYFYNPLRNLLSIQPLLQEAYVAFDRLNEIMDLPVEDIHEKAKIKPPNLKGEIKIRNLSFSYGKREDVLKNINLKIKAGEKVAFVGKSGSGKSTLIKLLLRYYRVKRGEILIDGCNIKDININSLRTKIGYVPQDIFLFSGTVGQNIAYGSSKRGLADIIKAAKKAGAHEFINKLPLRYETPVGERGCNLSGGQKQRLAIARTILKKPDIYIFDEATSNLGMEREREIYTKLADKTLIKIAHHLNTVIDSDKIFVFSCGKLVESGKHDELLRKQGAYFQLWQGRIVNEESNK